MPTKSVGQNLCSSHAPGWLNASHPSVEDGIVIVSLGELTYVFACNHFAYNDFSGRIATMWRCHCKFPLLFPLL